MPFAAQGEDGVAKPFGGIKIASLLQLAAINRENERSNVSSASSKAAPLNDVLNKPDAEIHLVPLSLVAPQEHDAGSSAFASLSNALDPKTITLSDPLQTAITTAHEAPHSLPQVRLPGVEDITKRPPKHGKAGVPLAEVLNEESRSPHLAVVHPSARRASVSSAGGRKRRRLSSLINSATDSQPDGALAQDGSDTAGGRTYRGQGITLPRLPNTSLRESKRQGLPPVITGLHDPPEETRLIPSISTTEGVWQAIRTPKRPHAGPFTGTNILPEDIQSEPAKETAHDQSGSPSPIEADGSPSREEVGNERGDDGGDDVARSSSRVTRKVKCYRRWTKDEAEDLISGVAKHGIGNWKRILDDPKFRFHSGRSAVDLKDRFRRCCPEEYQRAGESALHERHRSTQRASPRQASKDMRGATVDGEDAGSINASSAANGQTVDVPNESATAQFKRATRRGRVKFSEPEDAALERGFARHGPNWQKILVDPELQGQFANRKRTDLRDRFRNKWPDKFKAAKTKGQTVSNEQGKSTTANDRVKGGPETAITQVSPTASLALNGRVNDEGQVSNTAPGATSHVETETEHTAGSLLESSQRSTTHLPSTLLDDLHLNDAEMGFDYATAAAGIGLGRLILDQGDRGAQEHGLVSSTLADLPTATALTPDTAFTGLQDVSHPSNDHASSAIVGTTTNPAGMPLSSMLAGDQDGRDLMVNPSSIGYTSVAEPEQVLPGVEELSAPFDSW